MFRVFQLLIFVLIFPLCNYVYAKTERVKQAQQIESVSEDSINTIKDAINVIKNEYVTKVSEGQLVSNAINGMLASLDPHSGYYSKESFENGTAFGIESGVGIEITVDNGYVRIVTPIDGSPADKAGIKAGDYIVAIDGTSVYGMSSYEVAQKISGKPNSKVKLTVFREDVSPSMDFYLKRENIVLNSSASEFLDNEILYIRISSFDHMAFPSLEKTIKNTFKKRPPKGLIVDLRNNPGGMIEESVKFTSMFLGDAVVVYTRGRDHTTMAEYRTDNDVFKVPDIPVVVLINNGTASAAEIVAGALQDHKKGVVLGTRSFGKGSVQDIVPLEGDSAISLTTSLYYTPGGRSIQAQGVTPDIEIEDVEVKKFKHSNYFREENIEGHLEGSKNINQISTLRAVEKIRRRTVSSENKSCKKCHNDYMMIRAVDLVKGMVIYKAEMEKGGN